MMALPALALVGAFFFLADILVLSFERKQWVMEMVMMIK